MGTRIEERGGCIYCSVDGRLTGCQVPLAFPSVGATENVMVAAATAKGTTVITNAAREPEIVCLARFLNSCGARISGHGESTITVEGVDSLYGCCHTVIPDRIEAATYMAAAAVTSGEICLRRVTPAHLMPVIPVFEEMGCAVTVYDDSLIIKAPERLRPVGYVRTMPYPGFPTDCQAIVMSAACVADGTSVFVENIFDNRFKHVGELSRLGAHIKIEGRVAVVDGVRGLSGTTVDSTDLRGSAALVVAGLEADGETVVRNLHHLDRGYQQLELGLRSLGADIVRI